MVNRGQLNWNPTSSTTQAVQAGYYSGGTLNSSGAYNKGMADADARVNLDSESYKQGKKDGMISIYLSNVPCNVVGVKSSSNYYPQLDIYIAGKYPDYQNINPKEVFVNKLNQSALINWHNVLPSMTYDAATGTISLKSSNDYGVYNITSVNVVIIL